MIIRIHTKDLENKYLMELSIQRGTRKKGNLFSNMFDMAYYRVYISVSREIEDTLFCCRELHKTKN